jgi:hypothetical protein
MDELLYFIIIIILSIFILFYGGHNNQNKIEYNSDYFVNLNYIVGFEKKINSIYLKNNDFFKNNNFINIDKYFNTTNILLPNFVNCFLIKIYAQNVFNIYNLINKEIINNHMMIIFNHNKQNNLELIVCDNPDYKCCDFNSNTNNYFYDLEKNISITGIFHIFNNSNKDITITCFILKKPFWHK